MNFYASDGNIRLEIVILILYLNDNSTVLTNYVIISIILLFIIENVFVMSLQSSSKSFYFILK